MSHKQRKYNKKKLSQTRVKIENAFGLLKGRFRQLHRLDFHNVLKVSQFILAYCALHNICINYNDLCEDVIEIVNDNDCDETVDREDKLSSSGETKKIKFVI